MNLEWEDPPARRTRAGLHPKWGPITEELKRHPGRWAKVAIRVSPGEAPWIRSQLGLEVVTRNHAKDDRGVVRADIYARWPEAAS